MINIKKIALLTIFTTMTFCQAISNQQVNKISGEQYITGDDGIVYIYVNIWGHVERTGSYLVYDGADLFNALSVAGGPKNGANLKNISIKSQNGEAIFINIENQKTIDYKLKPYDTIIVNEKLGSKILSRSSIVSAVLQLINLIYTIDRLDND